MAPSLRSNPHPHHVQRKHPSSMEDNVSVASYPSIGTLRVQHVLDAKAVKPLM